MKSTLAFLCLGAALTVAVSFGLALTVDLSQAPNVQNAQGWKQEQRWGVTRWNGLGGMRIVSTRSGSGRNWGPGQALGPPDTLTGGDQVTAWASATLDGSREWLLLEFPKAVVPARVKIYEMCSTGAVDKITVFKPDGQEVTAWSGVDLLPRGQSIGTSVIELDIDYPISRLRIHLDSPSVPGYNEIDAVGLVSVTGEEIYASGVDASSIYGSSSPMTGGYSTVQALLPPWAKLPDPPPASLPHQQQESLIEARGWPMLSLWTRRDEQPAGTAPANQPPGNAPVLERLTLRSPSPFLPATASQPLLPLRPIWSGFAINTIVYATLLAALFFALAVPRRFFRETSRLRRGCCIACGYQLGYDFIAGCPECGWNRTSVRPSNGKPKRAFDIAEQTRATESV